LIAVTRNNQRYYLHNNHRGDITHVRMNNITLSTHRYTAFGQIIGTTTSNSRFRFSSKERDPSTGFYYYGYRFYAPQWQRWVNTDPIGEQGGMNLYCFVKNQPSISSDPFGLNECTDKCGKQNIIDLIACTGLTVIGTGIICAISPPTCAAAAAIAARVYAACLAVAEARYATCLASCAITRKCPPYPIGPYPGL